MNNKLWSIAVIIVAIVVFAGSYLMFTGAYHTNSNLAWRAAQAEIQGRSDESNYVISVAEQCGTTGEPAVVIGISNGQVVTECYK